MPRHGSALGEPHRPRNARWTAVQSAVDEVAETAQTESDRSRDTSEIGNLPEVPAFPSRDVPRCEDHSEKPAVERHASLPDRKNRLGITPVAAEVVKEYVTQPASDH